MSMGKTYWILTHRQITREIHRILQECGSGNVGELPARYLEPLARELIAETPSRHCAREMDDYSENIIMPFLRRRNLINEVKQNVRTQEKTKRD